MRANATSVLAQGVGRVPPGGVVTGREQVSLSCWDATMPQHLALPRAVGPYLIVRTTRRFSSSARALVAGFFQRPETNVGADAGNWSNICAVEDVVAGNPINGANNAVFLRNQIDSISVGSSATTVCPAAITLQIMNPEALSGTVGMVYAGVMNTQAAWGGRTETWDDAMERFVQFQAPRIMSAGKLCLRGVKVSSYPLDMSKASEFTQLDAPSSDAPSTWGTASFIPEGFAPIVVYNSLGTNLEYLVTQEWRVRFDLTNPASGAHRHYPMSTDWTWDALMRKAIAMGNGVRDIAEAIADSKTAMRAIMR
jgi:hypothetical protein